MKIYQHHASVMRISKHVLITKKNRFTSSSTLIVMEKTLDDVSYFASFLTMFSDCYHHNAFIALTRLRVTRSPHACLQDAARRNSKAFTSGGVKERRPPSLPSLSPFFPRFSLFRLSSDTEFLRGKTRTRGADRSNRTTGRLVNL